MLSDARQVEQHHGDLVALKPVQGRARTALFFFFQAEDGIRDVAVTGVQTCALPILKMDPIWDWNLSWGNANYAAGWLTNGWYWTQTGGTDYPWFSRLFQDPDFTQQIGRASCRERV